MAFATLLCFDTRARSSSNQVLQFLDKRPGSLLSHGKAGICAHAIDATLDIEDHVDPFHRFQSDGCDVMGEPVLVHVPGDSGNSKNLRRAWLQQSALRAGPELRSAR
jgi:hypothetical protein